MKALAGTGIRIIGFWMGLIWLFLPVTLWAPNTGPVSTSIKEQMAARKTHSVIWADSMYQAMTDRERIGQLFMIRAHSNLGDKHVREVESFIRNYHVGGLCFFQGTPLVQAELTNRYQALSRKVGLMIAMDAEWGLGMRFKTDVIHYPRNLMLGAIDNNEIIYNYARTIARQLRRIGVHVNFGPVVDINNNPDNPVINDRSFGEDKYNVVTKSFMYMTGLEDEGIMACGKHFPGHGDTRVDSHYDLPVISHSLERLEQIELFPFQLLADNGLQSIMVAHVHMPALDPTPNLPTTLSAAVVDTLLRQKLGFKGLIFTDALEMKGVTKHFQPGDIELRALLAGNDMLILPEDLPKAYNTLLKALETDPAVRPRVEASVKKILAQKYIRGIHQPKPVDLKTLLDDINDPGDLVVKEQIVANALTLLNDNEELIPVSPEKFTSIACLTLGKETRTVFQDYLNWYTPVTHYNASANLSRANSQQLEAALQKHDLIIIAAHLPGRLPGNKYGVSNEMIQLIEKIRSNTKSVLVVFGNPYALRFFSASGPAMMAYEDEDMVQSIAAQGLMGGRSLSGRLPVSVGEEYAFLDGSTSKLKDVIRFSLPESEGLNTRVLRQIDDIMEEMIKIKAAPGAQVLAMRDNVVIWHRAYGQKTYQNDYPNNAVELTDLYDIASITKIASATLAVMKMYEEGLIDLDVGIGRYLAFLRGTDKADLTLREIMAHRAGLYPWIPFYKSTIAFGSANGQRLDTSIYSNKPLSMSDEVAEKIYINRSYRDTIWKKIAKSELLPDKSYRYSDLGFILITEIVHQLTGQTLDNYVERHFYKPLGLQRTTYNPLRSMDKKQIVPTEKDNYFRDQLLTGHVHDMAAAMLGGVSGHAGLFSNALDLGILMNMLRQGGTYNGHTYLKPETINLFTTRYKDDTRRGIGFDMQQINRKKGVNVTGLASSSTFGHMGFTGTCAWTDPECGITYVFLSNRVHPSMDNTKLNDYQYRLRVHYLLYRAMDH